MSDTHQHDHDHDHEHDHSADASSASVPAPTLRDPRYWLSLEDWAKDPEFQKMAEKEFMSSPLQESDGEDGWARREFLKLMGASLAMASAGCIRRPVQKIVPYNKQPEEVTFTVPNLYTSTYFDGSEALGLLVSTREGRPLKIEGNPKHPLNKGATSVRAQAHILSLYDPERIKGPQRNLLNKAKTNRDTISAKWDDVDDATVKQLNKGGVVVLSGAINSPATRAVIGDFCQAFGAKHVTWEPLAHEEIRHGQKASYGEALVPFYRFDKAKVIVSIGADFLGTWMMPTTYTRQFSAGRKDIEKMNKLVVFDPHYSLTGANADVRIRIKPSQQISVVMGLAHEIVVKKGFGRFAGNASVKAALEPFAGVVSQLKMEPALFVKLAEDLIANKGKSLVVAGGLPTLTAQAQELQIAVNFLNSVLENDGETIESKNSLPGLTASYSEMADLIDSLNKGTVKTVIIHRTNPLYSLPPSFGFKDALKKADLVLYTGDRNDETGLQSDYLIPDHHPLENWGDAEIGRGLFSIHQPTIRPMYDTRSFELSLMTWGYLAKKGPKRLQEFETFYDYLRQFWKTDIQPKAGKGKSFDDFWDEALQDGVVGTQASGSSSRTFKTEALSSVKPVQSQGFELVLHPTVAMGDGSLANVAWLHELPDPVTKICWDNYVSVSIATAEALKLKEGMLLELTVNGVTKELPTHIQPGLHDDVLAVAVGYGRTQAGKVANGVGVNSYEMVGVKKGQAIYAGAFVEVKNTHKKYLLANPQGHHTMEGRQIVVEATLKEYLKNPSAGQHKHHIFSIWSGHAYNGHKWAMSVDLNSCTGCNACVVACQSENNIPVVGKKYVIQGREMYWIRVDRYYVGDPANAQAVFQPLMCQHCDNAPCESVCPVAATVHSDEGLNDMIYNRCVGTRYCANNCPYKVRRFNWFNFAKLIEKPMHLALNPDVTVRVRGVMEKCSFCVHRIKAGKTKANLEKRELVDGEIKTACQQVCPTDAIVFGDVNNPKSQVAQMFKDKRGYALLEEFHAAPNVRYQAKIRNNDQEGTAHDNKGSHS
ncbi:MAG: molybdopterin oxidoreductase [Bdellovibrio sp. CG10_big_fil_rev_8_21_14_0_10_47_8]|nr:MAG: molybdopterin oxidoreductase [Bdellovibrio sp. CG10_big_fil_rev_8_21_14_0_10_47_8]